jgi:phage protein D
MVGGQWLDVRYTLLGATKPLQTAQTRTWRQCSVAYMTQQIAALNGLNAITDPHSRVFDARQQSAQSDFSFLQDRAEESGYRLTVDGTTLCMTDPHRILVPGMPTFVQHRTPGVQDTMQAFRAVVGETDPEGAIRAQHTAVALSWNGVLTGATASAARVDPVSGASVAPQVGRYATGYVATSYADAVAITQAAAHRDLWWVSATATVDGDPRLRPGCAISVSGDAIASQYAGAWMVRSAHHRISLDLRGAVYSSYYVDLELGRDQAASLTQLPWTPVPQASSVLVGNTWRAGSGA